MHDFQPFPVDLVEINPFTKLSNEWALVTTGTKNKANTMTVSWGGVGVIWGKNVAYIFIRDSRYTKELLDKGEFFSISFMDECYKDAMNYCGSHSGRNEDKFKNAGITLTNRHGIPFIDESNFVLICNKLAAVKLEKDTFTSSDIEEKWYKNGDFHTMYIAEIIEILAR